jgi:hypothetical protein
MSIRTIGKPLSTADVSASIPTVSQKFRIPTSGKNSLLRGVVTSFIFYGDPAFVALGIELWSDNGGSPSKLIASSTNTWSKAQCLTTEDHALRWLGFSFNKIPLKAGAYYHIVARPTTYTGNDGSHIAHRNGYPDPVYRTGLSLTFEAQAIYPFDLSIITAEL